MGRSRKKGSIERIVDGLGRDVRKAIQPALQHPLSKFTLLALAVFAGPELVAPLVSTHKQLTRGKSRRQPKGEYVEPGVTYFPPSVVKS
jgi:hypothetical protein